MNEQEAVATLKANYPDACFEQLREAVDVAIAALKKQIPKKPTVPIDTWLCPSCGEPVEYQQKLGDNVLYHGQHDFCPNCGQAIAWKEDEQ